MRAHPGYIPVDAWHRHSVEYFSAYRHLGMPSNQLHNGRTGIELDNGDKVKRLTVKMV